MFRKDMAVKEYYKIILLFVVQLMLLTTFVINTFMKGRIYTPTKIKDISEIILGVVIFILCFATIFVVKRLYKTAQEQYMYKINELKYKHVEEQNRIHQRIKHDELNHLHLLSGLMQEGRYEQIEKYLWEYQNEIKNASVSVNTGLQEMDVLIYSKINLAQSKDVTVSYRCMATIECKDKNIIHLASILSNLLDNAIEACEKSKDRHLSISIKEDPIDYSFVITNTCVDSGVSTADELIRSGISTRGLERGLGLNIVSRLVDKFEGILDVGLKTGMFEVRVDLPKHKLLGL